MPTGFKILSEMEVRYRRLAPADMERVRVLCFGIFFCIATTIAMLLGITSAHHLGPIAGAIAGVELGGMIAGLMRGMADRFWP